MKLLPREHHSSKQMKTMNKLGQSNTLIAIIIAVAAGLLLAFTLIPRVAEARESQAESLCKTSVVIRAGTTIKGGSAELQTSPLLCKTLTPTIAEDKEDVSRPIAESMAKCWDFFGRGTYSSNVFDTFNIFGGGKRCFTCYVLPVEETRGFKENVHFIPYLEFVEFLRTTKYPADSERTFMNYFQTAGGPGNVVLMLTEKGILPNHAYAVSYKAGTGTCTWCRLIGGGSAAAVGGLLMFIPTGVTQVAGAVLLAGGGATAIGSTYNIIADDLLSEAAIDTIILSDITNAETNARVRQACNFVEDVEGKKLR